MSLFRSKRKQFTINKEEPTYKVKYLGNVQTALMRGEGCVDKPTAVLWNNFQKTTNAGLEMKLTVCSAGLKVLTKEQGLTEYRAHRISYCIAHPKYPKLFIWVYRHEGKRMKVELRCHAALCKTEEKAKAIAVQLHEKLTFALTEFMKEKTRRQTTRLALQRTNSLPSSKSGISGLPMRTMFLSTGQHFKPPVDRSPSAPKLGAISEGLEEEEEPGEEEEEEEVDDVVLGSISEEPTGPIKDTDGFEDDASIRSVGDIGQAGALLADVDDETAAELTNGVFDLEIGNDIDALKMDEKVQMQLRHGGDSDNDSCESGFSEQDGRECASSGTGSVASSASAPEGMTSSNNGGQTSSQTSSVKSNGQCMTGMGKPLQDRGDSKSDSTSNGNVHIAEETVVTRH